MGFATRRFFSSQTLKSIKRMPPGTFKIQFKFSINILRVMVFDSAHKIWSFLRNPKELNPVIRTKKN